MSAEIVNNKSRRSLAGMFGGERVVLGDGLDLSVDTDRLKTREIEAEIKVLPAEIVLYLKSLAPDLPELVADLVGEVIASVEEKEAARRLWERFGLPQSPLAVPVFAELSEDLSFANQEVQEKSYNIQALISRVERAIQKVLLFYAAELNRLEEETDQNTQATDQLSSIETTGSTMQERTAESVVIFTSQQEGLDKKRSQLELAQGRWLEFVQSLKAKLPILDYLERPIDLGAPDPAMAL
jgi:hypothetical protein